MNGPASIFKGLATAVFAQHSDLWTDGWFIWLNPYLPPCGLPRISELDGMHTPRGYIVAARAFRWIECIPLVASIKTTDRSTYNDLVAAKDTVLEGLHKMLLGGFEPVEVPAFSKNHIELVLLDLDQWEAEHTAAEAKDIVGVIQTANWLLKHGGLR